MKLRKNLPAAYDETYPLNVTEHTVVIEMSIVNSFLLDQLTMPMVTDAYGGREIVAFFQRCVAAEILPFLKNGLLTDEFYETNKGILDEECGIRPGVVLDTMGVYDLAYDLHYMMCRYMVILGHEERLIPKQNDLYCDSHFFAPRSLPG